MDETPKIFQLGVLQVRALIPWSCSQLSLCFCSSPRHQHLGELSNMKILKYTLSPSFPISFALSFYFSSFLQFLPPSLLISFTPNFRLFLLLSQSFALSLYLFLSLSLFSISLYVVKVRFVIKLTVIKLLKYDDYQMLCSISAQALERSHLEQVLNLGLIMD